MVQRCDSTCWTLVQGAAGGLPEAREEFARRYDLPIRAYLAARWRVPLDHGDVDDASQEVFLECFRQEGGLDRVDPGRDGGFRAFLYGIVRHVARRVERTRRTQAQRRDPASFHPERMAAAEESLSAAFDRAWAQGLMQEAGRLLAARAEANGEGARRRVELLRLRFFEGMKVREVADLWQVERRVLYRDLERARGEFRAALKDVVMFHHPNGTDGVTRECTRLLGLLG